MRPFLCFGMAAGMLVGAGLVELGQSPLVGAALVGAGIAIFASAVFATRDA